MFLKKILWSKVREILADYTRENKIISRCYIRHSAALEPQNPFLSDFDVTFFVAASNVGQLRKMHGRIVRDFKKNYILQYIIKHFMILPDSANAYDLCKDYYPFRLIYPFNTWLSVDKEIPAMPLTSRCCLPLDYTPENFIASYLIPVLTGKMKRNLFQRAFIARKIKNDYFWVKVSCVSKNPKSIYEALLAEVDIWGQFYKNLEFIESNEKIYFCQPNLINYNIFSERWKAMPHNPKNLEDISSLWIYPTSHNDDVFNLSLNLKPYISSGSCEKIMRTVLVAFKGIKYNLFLGSERAMIGRINGLSRACLLEPWLFKYHGFCLIGDPKIREEIKEPGMRMLREKYREFLFSFMFSTRFISRNTYPYAIYRLCFVLDHLFKHNEIILDDHRLAEIYGPEFVPEIKFNPEVDTPKFLLSLKDKHSFDLFGN